MGFLYRDAGDPSHSARMVLVGVSILAAFLTSGVIYGYSGLYKVLAVDERVFQGSCLEGDEIPCDGQSRSLTAAYTLGAATVSASAIFIGLFLDEVGPRWTVVAGSLTFLLGLLAMVAVDKLSDSFIYVGFFLLSLGGPAIFNSMMNFSELFPFQSAAIIAAQNGMFDASSIILFLMGKIVEAFRVPLSSVMLAYMAVPVGLLIVGVLLVADKPYGANAKNGHKGELWRVYHIKRSISTPSVEEESPSLQEPLLAEDSVKAPEDIYNSDIKNQLRSLIFWMQTIVAGYFILRSNFYIASIYSQLQFIAIYQSPPGTPSSATVMRAQAYVELFNWLLPFGGLLMVPVAGYVMVHLGMVPSFIAIGCMLSLSTVIQLLYFLPIQVQVVSFVLYSLVRPFLFGATAAFLGRVFGFSNFGRLYGLNRLAGALFTLLQYPLTSFAEQTLDGNYFYLNLAFLTIELFITVGYPWYLWKKVFYGFFFRPPVETNPETPAAANVEILH